MFATSSRHISSGGDNRPSGEASDRRSAASATATVSAAVNARVVPAPSLLIAYTVSVEATNSSGFNCGRVSSGPVGHTQLRMCRSVRNRHILRDVPNTPPR